MKRDVLTWLIGAIKRNGVAQTAADSQVCESTLYNWIHRRTVPSLYSAELVAKALGYELVLMEAEDE